MPQRIVLSALSITTPSGMSCRMRSFCAKLAGFNDLSEMVGVGVDTDKSAAGELRQGANRRCDFNDLDFVAEALTERDLIVVPSTKTENPRHADRSHVYRRNISPTNG